MAGFVFHELSESQEVQLRPARAELAALRFQRAALRLALALKQNFNPYQPRLPAGQPGGGQWANSGTNAVARAARTGEPGASGDVTIAMTPKQRDAARRKFVLAGQGGNFFVMPNPTANSNAPWYAEASQSLVGTYNDGIIFAAEREKVDPDLIRSIMYVETTQGHYFGLGPVLDDLGRSKTILPMNIHANLWSDLGSRADLSLPFNNIVAGAKILKGIAGNLASPSIEVIATLYNALDATKVSDYGARVAAIYKERPWLK